MSKLSIGIVGLPNVGKSTLFNALLKRQVADAANYPFCTIEPNVGIVPVPDERLPKLAEIVKTDTIVPAVVEFYDIAGLVKGAAQGEGLGNAFLSHIREVSAIVHVVRLFDDSDVIHVHGGVNPAHDIGVINTELILADLSTLSKQREPKPNAGDEEKIRYSAVHKLKIALDAGNPARDVELTEEEETAAQDLNLLTKKPVIFLANVSENQLETYNETLQSVQKIIPGHHVLLFSAKLETELLTLNTEEQIEYLGQYGLTSSGLDRMIQEAYKTLGLISFLTAGIKEVRAWTIPDRIKAPEAAGTIHTDFTKHFIKADIIPYPQFVEAPGWLAAREKGMVQTVGRDYIMKDGDVVEFKVNV